MQLVSYRFPGGSDERWRAGVEHGGHVVDAASLWQGEGREVTVKQVLAAGSATIASMFQQTRTILEAEPEAAGVLQVAAIELGPPVPDPDKIICIGLNYASHANEAGLNLTEVPVFFTKFRNSLIGPTSLIRLPRVSQQIDYEGELAVVIGARCKEVSEQEALRVVAGYSIMNDVSARDVQLRTSQWTAGKALDTFAPMGPGIVLAAALPNPQTLLLTTRVNGQIVQQANTATMLFSVATIIAYLSSLMTLEPGDIIATGTPAGVGFKHTPPLYLRDGDVAEVEIEGIGHIRNPVVGYAGKP